jgi:hypothetical protein
MFLRWPLVSTPHAGAEQALEILFQLADQRAGMFILQAREAGIA